MRSWLFVSAIALAAGALTWSCSGMHASGAGTQAKAAPEPQISYAFLASTADCRGEMFPCG